MFNFGKAKTPGQEALEQAKLQQLEQQRKAGEGDGKATGGKNKEEKGGSYSGGGFDPRGLERAAVAAKELDKSKHSKQVLQLIKEQEETKRVEHEMKRAEFEAYAKQQEVQNIEKEAEEARRTLQIQTEHEKKRLEHQDQLARKRHVDQINADRYTREQELARQEELVKRQEAVKRKTLEYEAELRQQTELARVKAETEGLIRQERENHDLRVEEVKIGAAEYRDTVLESIKLAGDTLGSGIKSFLSDREKMIAATTTLTVAAVGIYGAKTGTNVLGRYVEARLGKPSLVRETSRRTFRETLSTNPLPSLKRFFGFSNAGEDALKGVVLQPKLANRLQRVATSTANTKKNMAPFRHLLLYGPPGTGKTLFAKGLARHSGLEYAIMTGGDIAPLGRDAVTEMHKLFDWAQTSRKGLLLFVDESDAFLRRRSTEHISEDMRNALNAFLYRTGEATDKFMLVYASNQPEQFDWAINDRIDEMVGFELPGEEERRRMINMYMEKYLLNTTGRAKAIIVKGVEKEQIEAAVMATEGFSGREIAKLAIAWQSAAYGSAATTFTQTLMQEVLDIFVAQKVQKFSWLHQAQVRSGAKVQPLTPQIAASLTQGSSSSGSSSSGSSGNSGVGSSS